MTKIKTISNAAARIKKKLAEIKKEKELEIGCCENCERSGAVHFDLSHTIPRSRRPDLVLDHLNLLLLCRPCHHSIEAGRWPLMHLGKQIA